MSLNPFELIQASSLFFAREGDLIDGAAVTNLVPPDNDPADNWDPFGCIDKLKPGVDQEGDTPYMCYDSVTRTFIKVQKQVVVSDYYEWECEKMNDYATQLTLGLTSPIVPGATVYGHASRVREITGWLKFQADNVGDGSLYFTMHVYGALTLTNLNEISNGKTTRPKFRFTKRPGGQTAVRVGVAV